MGRGVVIALTSGKFDLGVSKQIFYYQFDRRRDKRALVKIFGE
jgi:thiamine phosphate synthase YjbQ (UPF0047 family)